MREIQCDAVIPPTESQQMLIGFFTKQADGMPTVTEYPRLWIVIIYKVFTAFCITHDAQFDTEIRVSPPRSRQGISEHLLIHLVYYTQHDTHRHGVLVVSPVQVKSLNI
jgi:hypothetical protein